MINHHDQRASAIRPTGRNRARRPRREPLQRPAAESPRAGDPGLLDRLTIRHIVLGFLAFRQSFLDPHPPKLRRRVLFRAEVALLEKWQEYHGSGWLSAEGFAERVEALVGDHAPRHAFAGFHRLGSILLRTPQDELTEQLFLIARQARATQALYVRLHKAIRAIRGQTHAQLCDVLGMDEAALSVRWGHELLRQPRREAIPLAERMVEGLGLSGAQQAQIAMDCAVLRYHVQRLHHTARDRFLCLLTPAQRKVLESLER